MGATGGRKDVEEFRPPRGEGEGSRTNTNPGTLAGEEAGGHRKPPTRGGGGGRLRRREQQVQGRREGKGRRRRGDGGRESTLRTGGREGGSEEKGDGAGHQQDHLRVPGWKSLQERTLFTYGGSPSPAREQGGSCDAHYL